MAELNNPLFNHLVLQNILQYLKLKELKNVRQVCKFWGKISLPYHLSISKVKILNGGDGKRTIEKYAEEIGSFHTNFSLEECSLKDCSLNREDVKELTLEKCKGSLKGEDWLSLEFLSFNGFGFEGRFANLKSLEVHEVEDEKDKEKIVDWSLIFSSCPQLKVLSAQCRNLESLILMLTSLSESSLQIEELISFLTEFQDAHLEVLASAKMPLKSLDIALDANVSIECIHILLNAFSRTLLNLKLFRDEDGEEIPMKMYSFPYGVDLKGLNSVQLMGNMVESLDILQNMPNLKHLDLNQTEKDQLVLAEKLQRSTCKSLKSISIEYVLEPRVICQLSVLFSNLTKISLYLNDESIRIIYSMENLKELQVYGTALTDEGICGIPSQILMRGYKYMQDYRKHPFIGDCKKLKKFSLYPQPQENISDSSVTYGFLFMEELTSIDLPETNISDRGIKELAQKPNLVRLSAPYLWKNGVTFVRSKRIQII